MAIMAIMMMASTGLLFVPSCSKQELEGRQERKENEAINSSTTTEKVPVFDSSQLGFFSENQWFYSRTHFSVSHPHSFFLRGKTLHEIFTNAFLKNSSSPLCLVATFTDSFLTEKKLVLRISSYPLVQENNAVERRGSLSLIAEQENKTSCSFISQSVFSSLKLCPSCLSPKTIISTNLEVFSPETKEVVKELVLSNLQLALSFGPTTSTTTGNSPPINESLPLCSKNSECQAFSKDCCLQGHCVKHGAVKGGVDQTLSTFLQAKKDIEEKRSTYAHYPQFFYACVTHQESSQATVPSSDTSQDESRELLEKMKRLYECTSPVVENYRSICTKQYEKASQETANFITGTEDLKEEDSSSVTEILYNETKLCSSTATCLPFDLSANNTFTDSSRIDKTKVSLSSTGKDLLEIKYLVNGTCLPLSSSLAKCEKHYVQTVVGNRKFILPSYASGDFLEVFVEGEQSLSYVKTGNEIEFLQEETPAINQKIVLSFYVSANLGDRLVALEEVKKYCRCSDYSCRLAPNKQANGYECRYSKEQSSSSTYQEISLSSKSVPWRYFDQDGVFHKEVTSETVLQESPLFYYEENDRTKPYNMASTTSLGMGEIFGRMVPLTSSTLFARPPVVASVKNGADYDIRVVTGNFVQCRECGNDLFSVSSSLLPSVYSFTGGGVFPSSSHSNRVLLGQVPRSYDFLFGRACFVPPTMIPWSHTAKASVQDQRKFREKNQHALFVNGYQRDWFGFNYGSVIGSFDGVRWFSIGSGRRIRSTSTKLFLAINAFAQDLVEDGAFTLQVQRSVGPENLGATGGQGLALTDSQSSGASCQKYHLCSQDNDCVAQLGAEYKCVEIANEATSWPQFNSTGFEIANVSLSLYLKDVSFGFQGSTKRCVYRGRGALCDGSRTCASNFSCLDFTQSKYSQTIGRFALPLEEVNRQRSTSYALFSLSSPTLGRPFPYIGDKSFLGDLSATTYTGMCLADSEADLVFALEKGNEASCNAKGLVSTMALQKLEEVSKETLLFDSSVASSSFPQEFLYQKNTCLLPAGSSCFSDQECAPSLLLADKLRGVDPSAHAATLNEGEISYWQEGLVCGNLRHPTHPSFNLKESKCCREIGKDFTFFTESTLKSVEEAPTDKDRYHRYLKTADKGQFLSLASNVCCTGHWVRSFHEDNGGGHTWSQEKLQRGLEKQDFRCLNWNQCSLAATCNNFTCESISDPNSPSCFMRSASSYENAHDILTWLKNLDLKGIPQAGLVTTDTNKSFYCRVDKENQMTAGSSFVGEIAANSTLATLTKFHSVFDANTFTCCLPPGEEIPPGGSASQCCSGTLSNDEKRCVLEDFVNVSVFFNKYVSSMGKEMLSQDFEDNGFLKQEKQNSLISYVCLKKMCKSERVALGVAYSVLPFVGHSHSKNFLRRFMEGVMEDNYQGLQQLYDKGLKWNTDVYCFPKGQVTPSENLKVFECSSVTAGP